MQIIGDIDEKYIDEAAPAEQKKKAMRFTPWVRYASIAACAMLVIGVGIFAITQLSRKKLTVPILYSTEIPTQNTIHLKKQKIRSGLKSAYPTATANIPSLIMRLSRGKSSRCSITMATTAE